jgi:hypothetical protein
MASLMHAHAHVSALTRTFFQEFARSSNTGALARLALGHEKAEIFIADIQEVSLYASFFVV